MTTRFTLCYAFLLYTTTGLAAVALKERYTDCKSVPGSPSWPGPDVWKSFNETLQGALLAPLPPAIACDPRRPKVYDNGTCSRVGAQWSNSSFHALDPVSVDWPNWQDDACLPTSVYNRSNDCDTKPFPFYVVNATHANHVAAAVKFVAKHKVRLSVKGTGHDFLARSTSPGLSIWTHHLQGMELHSSFRPQGCTNCTGTRALTVSAGHRMREIYARAAADNLTVVGGADGNVGLGGYLTGAGHSPISAKYGLSTDNVLEMKVVTPKGDVVIANEYTNQDLFWALRGGGGSTFGILITATMKTLPMPLAKPFVLSINSTETEASAYNNSNWHSAIAFIFTQFPSLAQAGMMGYFYSAPLAQIDLSASEINISSPPTEPVPLYFILFGWALDQPESSITTAFAPILARLNSTKTTNHTVGGAGLSSFFTLLPPQPIFDVVGTRADTVGGNVRIGSRLLGEKALTNRSAVETVIRKLASTGMNGLLVTGPGVWAVGMDTSAANPVWRDTVLHLIASVAWPYRNHTLESITSSYLTNFLVQTLRDHAPDTGCYLNESDVDEPDYQRAFWGSHYQRLLQIKRRWDPADLFWCKVCVGGEGWKVTNEETGEVCRVGPKELSNS